MKISPFQKQPVQSFVFNTEQIKSIQTQNASKERVDNKNASQNVNEFKVIDPMKLESYHIAQKYTQNKPKATPNLGREVRTSLQNINSSIQPVIRTDQQQTESFVQKDPKQSRNLVKVQNISNSTTNNPRRTKINSSDIRTNSISSSNSKSRISANISSMQVFQNGLPSYDEQELQKPTQSALKIKKLIGDQKEIFNNQFLQNQNSFKTGNSQSPIHRSNKSLVIGCHTTKAASISTDAKSQKLLLDDLQKQAIIQSNSRGKIDKGIDQVEIAKKLSQLQVHCQNIVMQNESESQKNFSQPSTQKGEIQPNSFLFQEQIISELINQSNNAVRKCKAQIENLNKEKFDSKIPLDKVREQFDKTFGALYLQQRNNFKDVILKLGLQFREHRVIEQISTLINNIYNTANLIIESVSNAGFLFYINKQQDFEKALQIKNQEYVKLKTSFETVSEDNRKLKELVNLAENERNALLQTISQMKNQQPLQSQKIETMNKNDQKKTQIMKQENLDDLDTNQLRDISSHLQAKLMEMGEKESKLIKLVLAIKNTGVDIEKIYNEEVLNDDSDVTQSAVDQNIQRICKTVTNHTFDDGYADNSGKKLNIQQKQLVINDSDESSFNFNGQYDNDSVIESVKRGYFHKVQNEALQNRNIPSSIKMKLDLSNIQQQRVRKASSLNPPPVLQVKKQSENQLEQIKVNLPNNNNNLLQVNNQPPKNINSKNTTNPDSNFNSAVPQILQEINEGPTKVGRLSLPFKNGQNEPVGFHQEFMMRLPEFSESWRIQALKDEKKLN